jgi:hypothetical protein
MALLPPRCSAWCSNPRNNSNSVNLSLVGEHWV